MDAAVLEAMQRWANDDLRSLNGQIEYVLRDALRRAGRTLPAAPSPPAGTPADDTAGEPSSNASGSTGLSDSTDTDPQ